MGVLFGFDMMQLALIGGGFLLMLLCSVRAPSTLNPQL